MIEEIQIKDKKIIDGGIYYLLQKGSKTKWLDFQQMSQHLQKVIQFEKSRLKNNQCHKNQKTINIIQEQISSQSLSDPHKIQKIIFIRKNRNVVIFEVIRKDGNKSIMTNAQMRIQCPDVLLDFYQKHIQVTTQ